MAHRVLLVDDDPSLLTALSLSLEDEGFEVVTAVDGKLGLARLAQEPKIDVILCDVGMPVLDGFTLCKRLRAAGDMTPLVLLTSRDGEIDQLMGLELGADDYVTKPFSTRVLVARVHALLRRDAARLASAPRATLSAGALSIDVDRVEVSYHGAPVAVTMTEFRLLSAFVSQPGVVFTRDRLLSLARADDDSFVDARIVDTYVNRLRRKLEAIRRDFRSIETVIGAGYRWRREGDA